VSGGFWPPEALIAPTCEALLPANLFALDAASNPLRSLPPRPPIIVASVQDPIDGRRIHLEWTQSENAGNAIDHWEVFELVTSAPIPAAEPVLLRDSGRAVLVRGLPRPAGGRVVLQFDAALQPLWDYAYVEARSGAGAWTVLGGEATSDRSPTGRNAGRGLTGGLHQRRLGFDLGTVVGATIDVAVRLDAMPGGPARARLQAALDVAATFGEERRVIDPDVRTRSYDLFETRSGIHAYGVTAVDADEQRADSELQFFVVPTTAVETSDVELERSATGWTLRFRSASSGGVRFEVWARTLGANEAPLDAAREWSRGDYALAARTATEESAPRRLAWDAGEARIAVLLRAIEATGEERLFGPYIGELGGMAVRGVRLRAPNPCRPGATLVYETASAGRPVLDVVTVGGRIVRRLASGSHAAGPHRVEWDGRDAAGRLVASGVYLVRLRAAEDQVTQRVVFMR
jgi:hypothetical protein